MTVNEIMERTNQKRGTIEQFRAELQKYKVLGNNEQLTERAVKVFEKAIEYRKDDEKTWVEAMQKAIQEEYGEQLYYPFEWSKEIILRDLIRKINNGNVKVHGIDYDSNDKDEVFLIIDNFVELGKTIEAYKGSFGTDYNGVISFKCIGKDYIYFIVGKLNHYTKNEDMHVFYNEGSEFNLFRCKHICGGSSSRGRLQELWDICRRIKVKELT